MMSGIIAVVVFLQQYVIPILFALGVIFFLYGFINSFMVGRPDIGQPHMIRSVFLFGIALILYGMLAFIGMVFTYDGPSDLDRENTEFGAEVREGRSVLPTPNVPSGND